MPLPPPPPTRTRPRFSVSPLVDVFSLTAAVFIFGGYPQIPWDTALLHLKKRVMEETPWNCICPTALFILGRNDFGKDFKLDFV